MRDLELVGLSADGRQVVFVDAHGAEFAAPADDRLRAALRGDHTRQGQLEIEMDSALRPRDIQARIRAGDTPETVATLAQVPVEKIMGFCIPVLAERQHVAELARRGHVRRRGSDGPSRTLGDVVAERLQGRGVDALAADWDAWRRDDGRWSVQATYHSGERERTALFVYDVQGRYSLADDDEARWLTGEQQATKKGPQPREKGPAGRRRLVPVDGNDPVVDDDDQLGLDLVGQEDDGTDDLTAVIRAVQDAPLADEPGGPAEPGSSGSAGDADAETTQPVPSLADEPRGSFLEDALSRGAASAEPGADEVAAPATPDQVESLEPVDSPAQPVPADVAPAPRPVRRRRTRRASVPSWDEIMFGKEDADKVPDNAGDNAGIEDEES